MSFLANRVKKSSDSLCSMGWVSGKRYSPSHLNVVE